MIKQEQQHDDNEGQNENENENKVKTLTPIRLKFSRCQEGSGYVMKDNNKSDETTNIVVANIDNKTESDIR